MDTVLCILPLKSRMLKLLNYCFQMGPIPSKTLQVIQGPRTLGQLRAIGLIERIEMIEPIQDPITGNEDQGDLTSPYQALVQFYHAFNAGDLDKMSRNWEQSEDIAMDNPLGGIKRGWKEISSVYGRIFNGPAEVYVEYYDYTIHEYGKVFYAVGRERGFFRLRETSVDLAIRTSRIFRKVGNFWRQTHHHGSIENAELLSAYQSAVRGK